MTQATLKLELHGGVQFSQSEEVAIADDLGVAGELAPPRWLEMA